MKHISLSCLLMAIAGFINAQPQGNGFDYEAAWENIDKLQNEQGLPESALAEVEKLYKAALNEHRYEQVLKAVICRTHLQIATVDDNWLTALANLRRETETLPFPAQAGAQSILGDLYWEYYKTHRWQIINRTPLAGKQTPDEIAVWDLRTLTDEMTRMYMLSLSRAEELQQIPVDVFEAILEGDKTSKYLRPTMYDLLLARAAKAFDNTQTGLTRPEETFVINKSEYFSDAESFAKIRLPETDTSSMLYRTLKLHRDRTKFRLTDKNPEPLVDAEILRLRFVLQSYTGDDKHALYEKALRRLAEKYSSHEIAGDVLYELAYFHKSYGENLLDEDEKDERAASKLVEVMEICRQILSKYPACQSAKLGYVNDMFQEIQKPKLSITNEKYLLPDEPSKALLKYKDLSSVNIKLYKMEASEMSDFISLERYSIDNAKRILKSRKAYLSKKISLPSKPCQTHTVEIAIDALPAGMYIVAVSDEKESIGHISSFQVTTLSLTSAAENGEYIKAVLRHRKTGEPLQNVAVRLYSTKDWNNPRELNYATVHSDKNGKADISISRNRNTSCAVLEYKGETVYVRETPFSYPHTVSSSVGTYMFTDRAIYRPGQTVYFKGLIVDEKEESTLHTDTKTITVALRDVNRREIANASFKVNEYSTFNGSFVIPQGLLNGRMTLQTKYSSSPILVEEYKRPTFEVKINAPKQESPLNSPVGLKGEAKALAGYAVDGATIKYNVVRKTEMPWWWHLSYYRLPTPQALERRQIASGTTETDKNGAFTINFITKADDLGNDNLIYNYTVTAEVTDANGETRSASYVLRAGKKPLIVETKIPDYIDASGKLRFGIKTVNLNGDSVASKIEVRINALKSPSRAVRRRLWDEPNTFIMNRAEFERLFPNDIYKDDDVIPSKFPVLKEVAKFSINTSNEKEADLSALRKLPSGWYSISLKAVSEKGITVEIPLYVQLANGTPNSIVKMDDWLKILKNAGEPGENAEFMIAACDKNAKIEYTLLNKRRQVIDSQIITPAGNTPEKFTIPLKEEHRGGVAAVFCMVYDNRLYSSQVNIQVPYTNKQLEFAFASFRDKLTPGENEKWTLTVKDRKKDAQLAELVATLYDASLDTFAPHSWNHVLNSIHQRYHIHSDVSSGNFNKTGTSYPIYDDESYYIYDALDRDYLDFNNTPGDHYIRMADAGAIAYGKRQVSGYFMAGSVSAVRSEEVEEEAIPKAYVTDLRAGNAYSSEAFAEKIDAGSSPVKYEPVVPRTNFNETAFFYPELRTNANGETVIEFTVPEALTRWKMLGFAHTKDLKVGTVERELITQKEVAISANAPRFFREGDAIVFTAKVNNITEKELEGKAEFEFFDALNMQPLNLSSESGSLPFSVGAGQSAVVRRRLIIPEGLQAVTCRVTARAGNHTDGEEKTIPVLANRMMVTESLPFSIRGRSKKTFVFERLKNINSNSLRNHGLTLEFTSNPAWYAVQALPYIMEYPYECSEQTFSRYYANTLASAVVGSSPEIKRIFELWNSLPDSKALISSLEKNQELKQILLEETPWLMNASSETERKKRIALLFDFNRMNAELNRAFEKLRQAQRENGAFPWFNGLPDDRYITQHIVTGMAHLDRLLAKKDASRTEMVNKAIEWLDEKIAEDYAAEMNRKNVKDGETRISPIQLQYLYLCSFSNHRPHDGKAYDFYMTQAQRFWNRFGLYEQGLAALAMHRAGKKDAAQDIVKSLKERARKSEETGMYWDVNRTGYFWYQSPVETQALMIEVFGEVAGSRQEVEEMRVWLLKNKQANDWKTTKATAAAVYALLYTPGLPSGTAIPLLDSRDVEVNIAGKPLATLVNEDIKPEPGTGYVKVSWHGNEVKKEMAEIEIKNPNEGITWGAMFWQYFENLDKITAAETNLQLKRELFVKQPTSSGTTLVPFAQQTPAVGELITVRVELRADRDFEYVHLKDARAAGLEPVGTLSGYRCQDGLWYYQNMKDASQNFFISNLRKGVYLFEYDLRVTHEGSFSSGISSIQCMYAPEFNSHSEGMKIDLKTFNF